MKMEKEVYSKATQAQGPYDALDMFQSYYCNYPTSYLQGLKYQLKEQMGFNTDPGHLTSLYTPPVRKTPPKQTGHEPGPAVECPHGHDSQKNPIHIKTDDPKDGSGIESPTFHCLHTRPSSSSTSEDPQKGKVECFYCDYNNINNTVLKTHLKKHKPERQLPCDKCDYFTSLTSSLKSHMLKHTDEKPLKCSYCDYSTKHNSALKLHLSKHTGIYQYSCPQCDYRTASSSSLKSHMLKHSDIKPLKCPFCDYCTKHKNALKLHLSKHNGILQYGCPQCDYRTASASSLKSHMMKHSEIYIYNTLVPKNVEQQLLEDNKNT
ncbi:unnamed protein product [Nezara viridula]|uniref:C2H2-type domain-containing protein n=1 Tax=Nezara viridula TaxID=85310 RepID=A0A9P0E676_NEZVI|nr:unnamed protein product [Nezara viridula]